MAACAGASVLPSWAENVDPCGGWRVNGFRVFHSVGRFAEYLKTAGPASIVQLEFSGHGTRVFQSMEDFPDKHVDNALWWRQGKLQLVDKSGQELALEWSSDLKNALAGEAVVYFYGCQTGWHDYSGLVASELASGIAREFSREFQVTTWGCPEFVYYRNEFPDFDEHFYSNPTFPATEGQSTRGGIWNQFRQGGLGAAA